MRQILFTILSLATLSNVTGQTSGQISGDGGVRNAMTDYMNQVSNSINTTAAGQQDVQGSAYTSDDFLPATLYYGNEKKGQVFYRYNAYREQIEIKHLNFKDAPVSALNVDKKLNLDLGDGHKMRFTTFIDKKGLTQNGYLTVLNSKGKYKLYKRVDVKFTEGQKAQNSFVKAIPPRFSKFTAYYLEVPGKNRIDELELNNRKLIKLVPDNQKESLKQYLKENNIKIKDENDVFKALNFLSK